MFLAFWMFFPFICGMFFLNGPFFCGMFFAFRVLYLLFGVFLFFFVPCKSLTIRLQRSYIGALPK